MQRNAKLSITEKSNRVSKEKYRDGRTVVPPDLVTSQASLEDGMFQRNMLPIHGGQEIMLSLPPPLASLLQPELCHSLSSLCMCEIHLAFLLFFLLILCLPYAWVTFIAYWFCTSSS